MKLKEGQKVINRMFKRIINKIFRIKRLPLNAVTATKPVDWNKGVDPRPSGLPVFNQRNTPSCGAHAMVTMLQINFYRQTGRMINFSPRFLHIMSMRPGMSVDDGRDMDSLAEVINNIGCCTENLLPNDTTLSNEKYSDRSIITDEMLEEAAKYKLSSLGGQVVSISSLKRQKLK